MWDWIDPVWQFFLVEANQKAVASIIAVLGVIGALWLYFTGRLGALFSKFGGGSGSAEEKPGTDGEVRMSSEKFVEHLEKARRDTEETLKSAHDDEKAELKTKIAELERQLANPDDAFVVEKKRIADLEDRLARMGNEIGGDRLEQAREALERFDYSVADEIFAEVEARNELVVQETARAAFGRGEVAEAEIRWHDAAEHFGRAARLLPDGENVNKAMEFAWRAGDYQTALTLGEQLIGLADTEEKRATALNNKALVLYQLGRYPEAERLFTKALQIAKSTIGEWNPDYAASLNNLALAVKSQGRNAEAEQLYTRVLEIDKATIGETHSDYAKHLNNLAGAVEAQGRDEESKQLCSQALEITKFASGEGHPDYAIRLCNLANVLVRLNQGAEAGPMYAEALRIFEATLPPDHPNIVTVKQNIANLDTPD